MLNSGLTSLSCQSTLLPSIWLVHCFDHVGLEQGVSVQLTCLGKLPVSFPSQSFSTLQSKGAFVLPSSAVPNIPHLRDLPTASVKIRCLQLAQDVSLNSMILTLNSCSHHRLES